MAGSKLKKRFKKRKAIKKSGQKALEQDALMKQGEIYASSGMVGQAENCFRNALQQNPKSFRIVSRLAIFLRDQMRVPEAMVVYQKALDINPNAPNLWNDLGVLALYNSDFEKARDSFLSAIKIQPENKWFLCNLGKSLVELGDYEESLRTFKQAIELFPDFAEAHYELGELYNVWGMKTKWEENCRKALEIDPSLARAHLSLFRGIKHSSYSKDIRAVEDLLANLTNQAKNQRKELFFALGKAYEDIGRYDDAFNCFAKGNRIQRSTYQYDIQEDIQSFEIQKNNFTHALFENSQGMGDSRAGAIFIVGMPRSGTTLAEQILASHPKVFAAGELGVLDRLVRPAYGEDLFRSPNKTTLKKLGAAYLAKLRLYAKSSETLYVIDKNPFNFIHIGMIRLVLPNAKVIHCCRHPMDSCWSIYKNMFRNAAPYACELDELGRYYLLYNDLMQHWKRLIPDFIYNLSYERLIMEQESQTRSLLEFCELEWDEKCLDFHKTKRKVTTLSISQVRTPIYKDSLHLWEKYRDNLKPLHKILEIICD